ncbi:hypothetical protein B0H14DRAFT_3611839 [Mycena olivaceomarginata]|nr:hypothetical protein B0H14DRAFT_3611839 [Mycena olivaceomarginata]
MGWRARRARTRGACLCACNGFMQCAWVYLRAGRGQESELGAFEVCGGRPRWRATIRSEGMRGRSERGGARSRGASRSNGGRTAGTRMVEVGAAFEAGVHWKGRAAGVRSTCSKWGSGLHQEKNSFGNLGTIWNPLRNLAILVGLAETGENWKKRDKIRGNLEKSRATSAKTKIILHVICLVRRGPARGVGQPYVPYTRHSTRRTGGHFRSKYHMPSKNESTLRTCACLVNLIGELCDNFSLRRSSLLSKTFKSLAERAAHPTVGSDDETITWTSRRLVGDSAVTDPKRVFLTSTTISLPAQRSTFLDPQDVDHCRAQSRVAYRDHSTVVRPTSSALPSSTRGSAWPPATFLSLANSVSHPQHIRTAIPIGL